MTLYSAKTHLFSHIVRFVLAEKGIGFDVRDVDLSDTPEDLRELNPYNEVPTLVDRDLVLYDYRVIAEYLDERFPHPPLMPVDPVSRARNRLLLSRINRDWMSLAQDIEHGTPKAVEKARKELKDGLTAASPAFAQKPFFLSDEFSLVDCATAPLLWRLPAFGIDMPKAAQPLLSYAERLFERPGFKESCTEQEFELRL